MVNYSNAKIYKIMSHLGDKIYIGSTTKKYLSQRMENHRASYKLWKADKVGKVNSFLLFDEYGVENCKIVLIELCPCESKDEVLKKEAEYITSLECVNKYIPRRTDKQYYQDTKEQKKEYIKKNKEHIVSQSKVYRELNKDKLKNLNKEWRLEHKEQIASKGKEYREANKDKIKQYYEDNKDKSKQYYADNKDKILERKKKHHQDTKANV